MVILTNTSKLKDLKVNLMVVCPKGIEVISFEALKMSHIIDPQMPLIIQMSPEEVVTPEIITQTKRYYENEEFFCVCNSRQHPPFISRDPEGHRVKDILVFSDATTLSPEHLARMFKIPLPAPAA